MGSCIVNDASDAPPGCDNPITYVSIFVLVYFVVGIIAMITMLILIWVRHRKHKQAVARGAISPASTMSTMPEKELSRATSHNDDTFVDITTDIYGNTSSNQKSVNPFLH